MKKIFFSFFIFVSCAFLFAGEENLLLIYNQKIEETRSFALKDIQDIEYLELIIDAASTPKGFNKFADGANGLTIFLNAKLPDEGEFGVPEVLKNFMVSQSAQVKEAISKSIWYFPKSFKDALGEKGRRTIKFSSSSLKEGNNTLTFKGSDAKAKPGEGDGIQISGFWIYLKRENKDLEALGETAPSQAKIKEIIPLPSGEDKIFSKEDSVQLKNIVLPIKQRDFQVGMPNQFVVKNIDGKKYEDLVTKMSKVNDVFLVSIDKLPFADFLNGVDVKSAQYDASFIHAKLVYTLLGYKDVYIALSPLTTERDKIIDLPSGFKSSFADQNLRVAFKNLVTRIARDLKPKYFSPIIETSAYFHKHPEDFVHLVSLYKEAYNLIKKESPETLVFPTFHYEEFLGLLSWHIHSPDWLLIEKFMPNLDAFAFSSYPYIVYSLEELPKDYYTQIRKHTDIPIIIAESGWPTSATGKLIKNLHGSEEKQKSFLLLMLKTVSELKSPLWIYWSLSDYDPSTYPDLFNSIGLTYSDGRPKPAWYVWRKIFQLPITNK